MIRIRADLHIHTLLSPCGDLEMTPAVIVGKALEKKLQVIGITDHNTTRQAPLVRELGEAQGLWVLCGAEVNTREEIHCLALFPDETARESFQLFLDRHLPDIPNDPARFGHQVQVDGDENIVYTERRLLISALRAGISETESEIHRLGGLFIPAHIDRPRFSLISQLGFLPAGLQADALEITASLRSQQGTESLAAGLPGPFLAGSDAHHPAFIGIRHTEFSIRKKSFEELTLALKNKGGRSIKIIH